MSSEFTPGFTPDPAPAVPPPLPPAAAPPFNLEAFKVPQSLHPRVVALWRIHGIVRSAVLLASAFGAGVFASFQWPGWSAWLAAGWLLLLVWESAWIIWYPPAAYRYWAYRLDDNILEVRHGIWFRTITLLPLSRLQYVDLDRGPLERAWELATLTFYTAGSREGAVQIPGLEATLAIRLRDHLVEGESGGDDGV